MTQTQKPQAKKDWSEKLAAWASGRSIGSKLSQSEGRDSGYYGSSRSSGRHRSGGGNSRKEHTAERCPRKSKADKMREKALVRNQYIISEMAVKHYSPPGEHLGYTRDNLYSIVLPMGHGKTWLRDEYGFIDFDDCAPGIRERRHVDNLIAELEAKLDWEASMRGLATMANNTLNMFKLDRPTLILVHDITMSNNIGATNLGSIVLTDEALDDATRGRTDVQRSLAAINHALVKSLSGVVVASDLRTVEQQVIAWCNENGIATGAPCKFNLYDLPPGYMYDEGDVVQGKMHDLDVLIELYDKGVIPKERVDYSVRKRNLLKYRGFGVTTGRWVQSLGMAGKDERRFSKGISPEDMKAVVDEVGPEFGAIEMRFAEMSTAFQSMVVNHWQCIGQYSEDPEILFRLYQVGEAQWFERLNEIMKLMRGSRFFVDVEISSRTRRELNDLVLLVPGMRVDMQRILRYAGDIGDTNGSSAASVNELEDLSRMLEVQRPIELQSTDVEKLLELNDEQKPYMYEWVRDACKFITSPTTMGVIQDMREMRVTDKVLICCLLHYAKDFKPNIEEICLEMGQMTHAENPEVAGVWNNVVNKINKCQGAQQDVWVYAVASLMCDSEFSIDYTWRMRFAQAIEELVVNAKICKVYENRGFGKAKVQVCRDVRSYCSSTIPDDVMWVSCLGATDVALEKLLSVSSNSLRLAKVQRGLWKMSNSKSLTIGDIVSQRVEDSPAILSMIAHGYEVFGESQNYLDLCNAFMRASGSGKKYRLSDLNKIDKIVYGSRDKNGFGYLKSGGVSYDLNEVVPVSNYSKRNMQRGGELKMASVQRYRDTKPVKMSRKQSHVIEDIGSLMTTAYGQERLTSRLVAYCGVSAGLVISSMCTDEKSMRRCAEYIRYLQPSKC